MFKPIFAGIRDLVYPPICLICQDSLRTQDSFHGICLSCKADLPWNEAPFCHICHKSRNKHAHMKCRSTDKTPYLDLTWSALLYQGPLINLIHHFKYQNSPYLYELFVHIMMEYIHNMYFDIIQFDRMMPIPLSSCRNRERSYNQSHLIAGDLGQAFEIPLLPKTLKRIKHTRPQTLLSENERWTNLKGAFKISRPQDIKSRNILLIDDLKTTGATANEAARILKDNGANLVGVFTLASA